jgi:hypothetical protein
MEKIATASVVKRYVVAVITFDENNLPFGLCIVAARITKVSAGFRTV